MSSEYQLAPASGSEATILRWPRGKPKIGAQRLPVGTDDGDFLDRRGVERGLPHRLDVARLAAIHAARRQTVERGDHLRDAKFGERDGALGGGVDLVLTLPIDQAAEPEIERKQRRAGEQHADDNRKEYSCA